MLTSSLTSTGGWHNLWPPRPSWKPSSSPIANTASFTIIIWLTQLLSLLIHFNRRHIREPKKKDFGSLCETPNKFGVGGTFSLNNSRYIAETSEILVSREFFFIFTSRSRSRAVSISLSLLKKEWRDFFSLFTSQKKWKLSAFHPFFSRKKSEIRCRL